MMLGYNCSVWYLVVDQKMLSTRRKRVQLQTKMAERTAFQLISCKTLPIMLALIGIMLNAFPYLLCSI